MKSKSKINAVVPSIILGEITIEGNVYGQGALEIDGVVKGNIRSLSVITGANSVVHGDITAERVEIHGEVLGNITAKKIICGATAKVRGNILHSTIHIESGAHIDGNCRKYVAPIEQEIALIEHRPDLAMVTPEIVEQVEVEPVLTQSIEGGFLARQAEEVGHAPDEDISSDMAAELIYVKN